MQTVTETTEINDGAATVTSETVNNLSAAGANEVEIYAALKATRAARTNLLHADDTREYAEFDNWPILKDTKYVSLSLLAT